MAARGVTFAQRVAAAMDVIAPLRLADLSWDNVGLLLEAPPKPDNTGVFLTIDLTPSVLEEALAQTNPKVGCIISYHPPIFKQLRCLSMSDWKQNILLQCAASGISIYSPHSALDNTIGGVNDWIVRGLPPHRDINPIVRGGDAGLPEGAGRLVSLQSPCSVAETVRMLCTHLRVPSNDVRVAQPASRQDITRIGVCAGSGGHLLAPMSPEHVDMLITGEMSHHEVLHCITRGITVVLFGHTNTERGYLSDELKGRLMSHGFPDVTVSSVDAHPLVAWPEIEAMNS